MVPINPVKDISKHNDRQVSQETVRREPAPITAFINHQNQRRSAIPRVMAPPKSNCLVRCSETDSLTKPVPSRSDQPDRQVDVENRPPAEGINQKAADQRSEYRATHSGARPPDRQRRRTIFGIGERHDNDRHRGWIAPELATPWMTRNTSMEPRFHAIPASIEPTMKMENPMR